MAFSIQTNVNSLIAQENLRVNSNFQSQTIQRLTSGYRINQSGDDAAGLAIANKFRTDTAELSQGVRNANDGISQLQIIDSGMNNVSKMLDRLRTLATQSASQTFTGDRNVVNSEFQTLLSEIDRQATSIGLAAGGQFAKNLSVYIGGGLDSSGTLSTENGTVNIDLASSAVDTKSLGLRGMQALAGSADLSATSATSVANIVADAANKASEATAGSAVFHFSGAGFADDNKIAVSVNLGGVTDTKGLVAAINTAIENAGNGSTAAASAFKDAGISASVHTDANGGEQIAFTSSTSAFQVQAGDRMSNAFMGNFSTGATGASLETQVVGKVAAASGNNLPAGDISVKISGAGMSAAQTLTIDSTPAITVGAAITSLKTQVAGNDALKAAGITVDQNDAGQIVFTNSRNEQFTVEVTGDTGDNLGLGAYQASGTTITASVDYDTTPASGTQSSFELSINGAAAVAIPTIDLEGGDAKAAYTTSGALGAETVITTGVNDALSVSLDGQALALTLDAVGSSATVTATTAKFAAAGTVAVDEAGGNDTFLVAIDDSGPKVITLDDTAAGGSFDAAEIVSAVDAQLVAQFGAGKAHSAVDGTGHLQIISDSGGSSSMVTVAANGSSTLLGDLGLTASTEFGAAGASATDVASDIQAKLNQAITDLGAAGAGLAATVTVSTDNKIVITSNSAGAAHTVSAFTGNAAVGADNFLGAGVQTVGENRSGANLANAINQELAANTTLAAAGIQASFGTVTANRLTFSSSNGTSFRLNAGAAPAKGTVTGTVDLTAGMDFTSAPMTLEVKVDGGASQTVTLNQNYANATVLAAAIDGQLTGASASVVSLNGKNYLQIQPDTGGTDHSVQILSTGTANNALGLTDSAVASGSSQADVGFGVTNTTNAGTLGVAAANSALSVVNASGTSQTGAMSFDALGSGGTQALTISANDQNGAMQSISITLAEGNGTAALGNAHSGDNIDQAVAYINKQLQGSNNDTLKSIVAVKQTVNGDEQLNFISSLANFQVGVGTASTAGQGINGGVAGAMAGTVTGSGSTISVETQGGALSAVNAIAGAVTKLGSAQAAVGRGQNQLNYAVNLAQSQISSFSAAESRIRDADVANEAANLTKAQVLQQASMAAMAQANSAPQAVLALLRG